MKKITIFFVSCFFLSSCSKEGGQPNEKPESAPETHSTQKANDVLTATKSEFINLIPSELSDCDPVPVSVNWDVSKNPEVQTIEIYIGSQTGTLFAASTPKGEAKTGNWAAPGMKFVLVNPANKQTLGEASIGGPACTAQ